MIPSFAELMEDAKQRHPMHSFALFALVGSRAFNVHTEDSDYDFVGVYVPKDEYLLGFKTPKNHQYEHKFGGQVSLYPVREFLQLVLAQNPNLDFIPHIVRTPVFTPTNWEWLRNSSWFHDRAAASRSYFGYANSQYKGAFERPKDAGEKRIAEWEKFGYVPKQMSHAIRILRTGKEFVETGYMPVFRDEDSEELKSIRRGEWSVERISQVFNDLLDNFPRAENDEMSNLRRRRVETHLICTMRGMISQNPRM